MNKLPRLTVDWAKDGTGSFTVHNGVFPVGDGVQVGVDEMRPSPVQRSNTHRTVLVLGAPVVDDGVSPIRCVTMMLGASDLLEAAQRINGQFLIIVFDKKSQRLIVINDRFNGVPFYWADLGDRFVGAYLYSDLVRVLRQQPGFAFRQNSMMQFLWLNRVIGDVTHDIHSRFLSSASVLTVERSGVDLKRYWRPDFSKDSNRSVKRAGEEFTYRLQTSLRRLTQDDEVRRYGHFLSGGHDSRVVLAAFDNPPECFTVAFSENLEVNCARRAAAAVGANHHFLRLSSDHLVQNYYPAVELCSGMYTFEGALFLGLEKQVQDYADVVFHGHALDYLFQGMYLPANLVSVFGRPTFFRKLQPLTGDLIARYLNTIPFRVKGVDIGDLLRDDMRAAALQELYADVEQILDEANDCAQTDADRWEYLIIHALGRHYSQPNISSKLTCAEQRTPCFDNDLFNFYLSLIPEHRVNAQVMRHALKSLNPELARIPTGNWGMPAGASPCYKTAWLVGRKALRHITGNQNLRAPELADRTWPDREAYIRCSPFLINEIRNAVSSEELREAMPIFNWPKVAERVDKWLEAPSGGGAFMMALITLNQFLIKTR